jgi:glucose/arabinose dehydrogenase
MIAVPPAFTVTQIATVPGARELAFAPNGDLYVGTRGQDIYIVRHAAGGDPASPAIYVTIQDAPDSGVAYGNNALYVGTQHGVWRVQGGHPVKLADVRTGNPPPGSDGDVHRTTSVTLDGNIVYASVGSSCNACVETDATRATIGKIENGRYVPIATHIRNAIALAIDPSSHALWAANAGQDDLAPPHPYEFFDDVSAHRAPVNYKWPFCYEDHKRKDNSNENCSNAAVAQVVFPAYETPIGAVFYPESTHGRYAFPAQYRGGAFVTLHGSWHGPAQGLAGYLPPRVVFVPMHGERPVKTVDWGDPSRQWTEFVSGYQNGGTADRSGRPSGIAVGPQGGLYLADDETGAIYRITPKVSTRR